MTRDRYLVVGANGELGQALLRELGPERAIAATRKADTPLPGFEHVRIGQDGTPPAGTLARCAAVINAAGSVTSDKPTLQSANIDLPRAIAHAAKDAGVPRLVQVSSFSILGAAEHIDDRTVERPINAYGRSKAAAEHVLLGNSDDAFSVECVRLPFLFSAAKPSLLAPLLSLATRLRHLPAASGHPVRRSMITYADAARQLANAARSGTGGISFAADPPATSRWALRTNCANWCDPHTALRRRGLATAASTSQILSDMGGPLQNLKDVYDPVPA